MALSGADVKVEMYLDSAWVDITSYVRVDAGITIRFGIQSESGTADPATCTLTLTNADGRFTPSNPTGPYYGFLKRNTGLRVSYDSVVRYVGEVSEFPPTWDPTGRNVTVNLVAAGPLRRLLRGRNVRPAMNLVVPTLTDVVGYWPMDDGPGSESFASGLPGGSPMTITAGAPEFATYDPTATYPGSEAIATFPTGTTSFGQAIPASGTGFVAAVMIGVPSGGTTDEAPLFNVFGSGSVVLWSVEYDVFSTGALRLRAFTAPGGVLTEVLNFSGAMPMNGITRILKLAVEQNGGNVDWELTGFGVGAFTGTINTQTTGAPIHMFVNPAGTNVDVAFGHAILGSSFSALDGGGFDDGIYAYRGESVEDRMARLAALAGLSAQVLTNNEGDTADSMLLGPQRPGTVMDALRDAEATDMGILRDALNVVSTIVYATRRYRYNYDPEVVFDYAAGHITPPMAPTTDDQLLRNDVTVNRYRGSSARAEDATSPLSTQPPPDGVGVYGYTGDVNPHSDATLPDIASWILYGGTIDVTRYPQVTVDLVRNPSLTADVDTIRPGKLIEIENLPGFVASATARLQVIGWTEYITEARRTFTFNCIPADVYDVMRAEEDPYGRLDSDTTTTSEALDTTETGVDYTGDTWITTASRPDDFPFDIIIGGEVMTVTSATSSTFTVTRSVNGVVKSHLTGQPVRLHRPNRIAL